MCSMALHKESLKNFTDIFVSRIKKFDDFLLLLYHCFDDLSALLADSSNSDSVFDAINFDAIDVMLLFQTDERQNKIFQRVNKKCIEHNIPVISIDVPFEKAFFVSFGYGDAFSKIVEHIITEHGCKKIKHMAGIKGNDFTQTRIDACRDVMAKHGLTLEENDIMYGQFWAGPTEQAMEDFFQCGEEMPDAFVCANDAMAMTVCRMLTKHGYKVPKDVIVTGFDGIEHERYHIPRLTTAKRDNNQLVDAVLDTIWKIRDNPALEPFNTELSYMPVFSESCTCFDSSSEDSGALFTEFIKTYDYIRGHEEYMHNVSNHIASNPCIDRTRDILRGNTYAGNCVCLTEDFTRQASNVSGETINNNYPQNMMLFLSNAGEEYRTKEGQIFSSLDILPDMEEWLADNNAAVITSVYSAQFIIGYLVSYYILDDHLFFKHLYTYNMTLNRSLETVRLHENMRALNKQMEFMFTHDQLTKIYNRYGFYKNFKEAFASHSGKEKDIFIASVDLNDMKFINDNFGHSEGDEALRMTANALLKAASAVDDRIICSRFGGDEFVVAMIGDGDGEEKSQLFRESFVFALNMINEESGKDYKVSASIGLSCSPLDDVRNIEELIERADRMMYTDKARHKRRPKGM